MEKKALPMKEIKKNLQNLDLLMPGETNALISPFGKHLTNYLDDALLPEGFIKAYQKAISDLQNGTHSHPEKEIEGILIGHPKIIYSILEMSIPEIVDAALPFDFAKRIKDLRLKLKNAS